MDKSDKDKEAQGMYRWLRFLDEEAKKHEISAFYKLCKSYYDSLFLNWRRSKKKPSTFHTIVQ